MTLEFSRVPIGVPLVSLETAKEHLHIAADDTDHDADVAQKLEAAQELICAKLGAAVDPAWDETTAPRLVQHSILIVLDAFNERRGGDEANDPLRKALDVTDLLLAMYRDPTIR